jgi:hypothetical protein
MTDMQTQTIYQPMMAHEIMELRKARALCREWPTHRAFEQRKIVEERIKKIRHERYLPCLIERKMKRDKAKAMEGTGSGKRARRRKRMMMGNSKKIENSEWVEPGKRIRRKRIRYLKKFDQMNANDDEVWWYPDHFDYMVPIDGDGGGWYGYTSNE